MADEGDRRRNPPPLPSTYVTLVQLQERWTQEKQRKHREKEDREEQERQLKIQKEQEEEESEKRKCREEEEQQQKQRRANLHERPVQSTTTTTTDFPRRSNHHRPPLKSSVEHRALRISDEESKRTDDLKKDWKMKGKLREEDLVDEMPVVSREKERVTNYKWKKLGKARIEEDQMRGGKEQLLHEKEGVVDEIPVVSTGRGCCEKERVTSNRRKKQGSNKRGKARVKGDQAVNRECFSLEKEVETAENVVPVASIEGRSGKEIGGKCDERVPGSGGKRGNGSHHWGLKNRGNDKRVAEVNGVSIGREEMLPKKEVKAAENVVPVVLTETRSSGKEIGRKCEEKGVSTGGGKKGNERNYRGVKNGGNNKRVEEVDLAREDMLPKEEVEAAENVVPMVSTEIRSSGKEIRRKCEEVGVSAGGGKMRNGKYYKGVKIRGNDNRVGEEDLMSNGREEVLLKKEVEAENVTVVVSTERRSCGNEIGGKCEEEDGVSAGGGKKVNCRNHMGVKIRGNDKRVEKEDLVSIVREEVFSKEEVEVENVAVVISTERDGGRLEEGNGRNLMVYGCSVWEKKVVGGTVVDRSERVLSNFEGLSVRGGGYGRNARNVNGARGRYRLGYGRGSDRRLQRPRDSNLVWVIKEEGGTSDVNVAGV